MENESIKITPIKYILEILGTTAAIFAFQYFYAIDFNLESELEFIIIDFLIVFIPYNLFLLIYRLSKIKFFYNNRWEATIGGFFLAFASILFIDIDIAPKPKKPRDYNCQNLAGLIRANGLSNPILGDVQVFGIYDIEEIQKPRGVFYNSDMPEGSSLICAGNVYLLSGEERMNYFLQVLPNDQFRYGLGLPN